nr:hypothetical protein [Gimesia aquarii]
MITTGGQVVIAPSEISACQNAWQSLGGWNSVRSGGTAVTLPRTGQLHREAVVKMCARNAIQGTHILT